MKIKIESMGQPSTVQTKYGPKQKNWVKVEGEYAGKFLNYWLGENTKNWQVGMIVDVENVEKRDYTAKDGSLKTSYDIKMPRVGMGEIMAELEALRKRVYALEVKNLPVVDKSLPINTSADYPEEDFNPPF